MTNHSHRPQQYSTTEDPSDTARSTFGYQAELPPSTSYEPKLYYKDNTSNLYVYISSGTVQSSATNSKSSTHARREPKRHLVQAGRLPTEETHHVSEGQMRMAREVSENYRRQGLEALHRQERQFEEATMGSGKTSSNRDSKSCHADDFTFERPFA